MVKFFILILTYIILVVQLISVLSFDFSNLSAYAHRDLLTNFGSLLLLMTIVCFLSRRLVKEMLTGK